MTIYKYLPNKNFTKFDNNVLRMDRALLNDGAKVLYVFLASMRNGKTISYGYLIKSLGYAEATIMKYIRQLKELDLISAQRRGSKNYIFYIGSTQLGASTVKEYWKELDESDATLPLTLDDLRNIREVAMEENAEKVKSWIK